MRIAYGCQLVRARNYGVGNAIVGLLRALVETASNHDLVVLAHPRLPEESLPMSAGNLSCSRLPALTRWRLGRVIWDQLGLPGRLQSERIHLLHAPGYVAPLAARIPIVLTVWDLLALQTPHLCRWGNRWHYRALLPPSVRRADRIIVPSSAVLADLLQRFPEVGGRAHIVPPGVADTFRTPPASRVLTNVRRRYGLPEEYVLFVGRHEPKKNLERLVAAYRLARRAGDVRAPLVLVGDHGWGGKIAAGVACDSVRRLGFVPEEDLRAIYRLARLVVFPSLEEGFGLPVVEAMASGVPVVCSSVPALLDADPEAAIRVNPRSASDIARGLARGWRDDGLRSMLIARGIRAAERFTWTALARRHWSIYEELVEA